MNLPTLLSKAKELGEKATPAPWTPERYDADNGYIHFSVNDTEMQQVAFCHEDMHPKTYRKDAAFIAFARSALPLLVRIVERQQACLERYSKTQMTKTRELPNGTLTYEWPFGFGSGWATDALAECEKIAEEMR